MERPTELEKAILRHGLGVFTSKPKSKAHIQRVKEAHQNFRIGLSKGWTRNKSIEYALKITSIAAGGDSKHQNELYKKALAASSPNGVTSIPQLVHWTRQTITHESPVVSINNKPPLLLLWQRVIKIILGDRPPTPCEYESI